MNYIAIETSTNICSVALFKSNEMIDLIENEEKKSHSKELGVSVKSIIDNSNISINDISYIALSSGPGSFTGLRIGSSLAKGMAFALKIPIVMVPTLQSLEFAIKIKENHNICVFSHSDQFYLQNFKNGLPNGSAMLYESYKLSHDLYEFDNGSIVSATSFDNLTDLELNKITDNWKKNKNLYNLMKEDLELYN